MHSRKIISLLVLTFALVALGGCSNSNNTPTNPLDPFQPEVISVTDNFQFQATNLTTITGSVSYGWQNTGTQAVIDHSSAITSGQAMLTIRDEAGIVVYQDSLRASGSDQTAVGVPGTWIITVSISSLDGTLNFRAQTM